jgi:hypothetical protein
MHNNGFNFNPEFRSLELKESKLNKYKIIVIKYAAFGLIIMIYFFTDYFIAKTQLKGYLASNKVYDSLCERI